MLEQQRLIGRERQQGMALALGENVASWHPMSSLLNISLFWTNIAQAKSVGYRPRSRGGSMGRQRTAIYARVSTTDQSCQRQIAELTAFADRSGFEVLGIFEGNRLGSQKQPAHA